MVPVLGPPYGARRLYAGIVKTVEPRGTVLHPAPRAGGHPRGCAQFPQRWKDPFCLPRNGPPLARAGTPGPAAEDSCCKLHRDLSINTQEGKAASIH